MSKDILVEQFIDGVYKGIEIANAKLEPYGLKVDTPSREELETLMIKK